MRRFLAVLAVLSLLVIPVDAAETTKYVALTFDDGPSGRYTRRLLDGLWEREVKATFLLCGYRIKDYPDITQRIFDEGHEIGYHGYTHKNMKEMSRRTVASEIMDTQALLPEGCEPVFLRPPGGCCSDAVRQVAEARQLAILSWSVDPRDWATSDTAAVERAVLKNVKDGEYRPAPRHDGQLGAGGAGHCGRAERSGLRNCHGFGAGEAPGCEPEAGKDLYQFSGGAEIKN